MSNNLFKSRWIVADPNSNKRVIDSNDLVLKKIEEERKKKERKNAYINSSLQNKFEEGLHAKQVESLFDDAGVELESNDGCEPLVKELDLKNEAEIPQIVQEIAYVGPSPQELVEEANQEIKQMKTKAEEEICQMQVQAQENAKAIGYTEGKQRAKKEYAENLRLLKEKEKQLENVYEERLSKMEENLVESLTDVYSHVLGVSLADYGPTILHVLDVAIHESDDVKNYIIHVSKNEVNMVKNNMERLKNGLSSQTEIEIIEDVTMTSGEAYIETEGEIFDCSIDTQLSNLSKQLKALAYQKKS